MTTATTTNNTVCAMCSRTMTVKVKVGASYVCPACYRAKVMR
jgi:predicted RNA-binding Zn-ribbon protein involved in translation (DUF1610 family)